MGSGGAMNQFLAALVVNLCTIGYSISIGCMGMHFNLYLSYDSPLPSGPMKYSQISWLGSLFIVGGFVGTIFAGLIVNRVGRKYSLLAMAFPQALSYLLVIFAQNVYFLYISRFLSGFAGGAVFVLIPLMVIEVAEENIRGTLSTIMVIVSRGGILVGVLVGHFLPYKFGLWLNLLFPILFFTLYAFMPETPYYLMKSNRVEDAEKSLRFYRNAKSFKMFDYELSKLKYTFTTDPTAKSPIKINDFFNRPFAICCILMVAHEFCGVNIMLRYGYEFFTQYGLSFTRDMSGIIASAIQLIGLFVSSLLIDRLGRKLLMVISFTGMVICYAVIGTSDYINNHTNIDLKPYNGMLAVIFSTLLFMAACGALSIPYVMYEILPHKIRSQGITLVTLISWILSYVIMQVFPVIGKIIGMSGCMYLFGICCTATVIYVLMAVPETKRKSLDEILLTLKVK